MLFVVAVSREGGCRCVLCTGCEWRREVEIVLFVLAMSREGG